MAYHWQVSQGDIYILDLPLSFEATGCTRELSHKRKLSLLFAAGKAASSSAEKKMKNA
jgi:hypothetical protein